MSQERSGVPNGGECALEAPMVHWALEAPMVQLRPVFLARGLGSLCPLGCPGFGRGLK